MKVIIRMETITDWGESNTHEFCQVVGSEYG